MLIPGAAAAQLLCELSAKYYMCVNAIGSHLQIHKAIKRAEKR